MKTNIVIVEDISGHKIVILPEIIFKNKRSIDWNAVEKYLQRYVREIITIAEAKANAAQGIRDMAGTITLHDLQCRICTIW